MEETTKNQVWKELGERAKELNCLYEIDTIIGNYTDNLELILEKIIHALPSGWRYPDKCKVEILCNGLYFSSQGIVRTELKQTAAIILDSVKVGEICIYYIKPVKSEKGIFLQEEQKLLNAVCDKVAHFIRFQNLSKYIEALDSQKQQTEHSSDGLTQWLRKQHLTPEQIESLCSVPIRFKKGENIGKQGAITSYFLLLAEGFTKSTLENQSRNFNFLISKPYDFIGLSSLFGNNYYFSTSALTTALVYLIDKNTFIQILSQNERFNTAMMQWYCNSYKIIFQKLQMIANKQAIGRMAETLLYLSEDIFSSHTIPSFITRKEIAGLAGISTENAVRILSDFRNDNIINMISTQIEILNFSILRTLTLAG